MRARATAALISAASVGLAVGLGVASCGGGVSGNSVTVPVLWAAGQSDGSMEGGIEPAKVEVGSTGEPGYGLVLDDLEAKEAGPQWKAASASAAGLGTLVSGRDPNELDVAFSITGPIDGPSGGGALTVAVLAAIRGDELRDGVTMTGTINPDGSIGVVSYVSTKIRAAAREGFDRVLIPLGTERQFDEQSGEEISMRSLGEELGVEVRTVSNLGLAYRAFTGETIAAPTARRASLGSNAKSAAERTSRELLERLDRKVSTAPDDGTEPSVEAQVRRARAALEDGDTPLAYGLGVDAYFRVVRLIARQRARGAFAREGSRSSLRLLSLERESLAQEAERRLEELASPRGLDAEQLVFLPEALGWTTTAQGVLDGLEGEIAEADKPGRDWVEDTAAVLADQRAQIEVFAPDAVKVLRASTDGVGSGDHGTSEVSRFLSGYTNFLARAGAASEAYFEEVVEPSGGSAPAYVASTTRALGERVGSAPEGVNPLEAEIVQSARAISYFTLGAILVGGGYSFDLSGAGIGEDASRGRADLLLDEQAVSTGSLANALAVDLQRKGLGIDYAVWQTRWGLSLFEAMRRTSRGGAAALISLGETQPAAIGGFMAEALVDSGRESKPPVEVRPPDPRSLSPS